MSGHEASNKRFPSNLPLIGSHASKEERGQESDARYISNITYSSEWLRGSKLISVREHRSLPWPEKLACEEAVSRAPKGQRRLESDQRTQSRELSLSIFFSSGRLGTSPYWNWRCSYGKHCRDFPRRPLRHCCTYRCCWSWNLEPSCYPIVPSKTFVAAWTGSHFAAKSLPWESSWSSLCYIFYHWFGTNFFCFGTTRK